LPRASQNINCIPISNDAASLDPIPLSAVPASKTHFPIGDSITYMMDLSTVAPILFVSFLPFRDLVADKSLFKDLLEHIPGLHWPSPDANSKHDQAQNRLSIIESL
jgi:hypothetical protein